MKIRKECSLAKMYSGSHNQILATSPELKFINAVCNQDFETALGLFSEKKLFGNAPSAVDAPYGRFEGIEGIRSFAEGWLPTFHAKRAFVTPVIQTRANGRSVTELVVNFVVDNEINQVPMFVIGDLRTKDTLDEVRLYCHHTFVPGLQAYRKPIFKSAHLEMGDPGLLTGAVREYYEALHHVPHVDVDRILACMSPNCKFGGYEPVDTRHATADTPEEIRKKYEAMAEYIPRCVGMRYETIIDDGTTCVIEWVHIVTRAGQEERKRIAISGVAAYERGEDGLLCSIRISDYAGYEHTIDWTKTPVTEEQAKSINFVESFPAGVGRKPQS
ncbi:MAG: nuclear transport factor 2 family protein [Bacillota bacterium]|jgi:hypothetical protein|nr:nuclear transport factor 2 family protein [Bacillota bacterium]